jgi:hypothetical protein
MSRSDALPLRIDCIALVRSTLTSNMPGQPSKHLYRNTKNASCQRLFARLTDDDSLSVRQSHYTHPNTKATIGYSPDDVRNPMYVLYQWTLIATETLPSYNAVQLWRTSGINGGIRDRFSHEYHYTGIAVTVVFMPVLDATTSPVATVLVV